MSFVVIVLARVEIDAMDLGWLLDFDLHVALVIRVKIVDAFLLLLNQG